MGPSHGLLNIDHDSGFTLLLHFPKRVCKEYCYNRHQRLIHARTQKEADMGIISWIVVGVVVGIIACLLTRRTTNRDYVVNSTVGLVGALLGGFSSNLVTRQPPLDFNVSSLIVAVFGALVFLVFSNGARRS
jgi:uncharacterized membrane protein YeaQ/YmgE (transglycosylase-associated protein family)